MAPAVFNPCDRTISDVEVARLRRRQLDLALTGRIDQSLRVAQELELRSDGAWTLRAPGEQGATEVMSKA